DTGGSACRGASSSAHGSGVNGPGADGSGARRGQSLYDKKKGGGRPRKATGLAELERYMACAQEAAEEVLGKDHRDITTLKANATVTPATATMLAINLASGKSTFREKLKQNLEATGGIHC
ncbi:unnamed protein product, partial [Discosporangium mesarthrocarpum]